MKMRFYIQVMAMLAITMILVSCSEKEDEPKFGYTQRDLTLKYMYYVESVTPVYNYLYEEGKIDLFGKVEMPVGGYHIDARYTVDGISFAGYPGYPIPVTPDGAEIEMNTLEIKCSMPINLIQVKQWNIDLERNYSSGMTYEAPFNTPIGSFTGSDGILNFKILPNDTGSTRLITVTVEGTEKVIPEPLPNPIIWDYPQMDIKIIQFARGDDPVLYKDTF